MERLLNYFVPESYDLALCINKKQRKITGRVIILGEALASEIKLHAKDLHITGLRVKEQIKTPQLLPEDGLLIIPETTPGQTKIEIDFHFALTENMQGVYISKYKHKGKTEEIVATQFESHYARECFPCIDEPAAKASFKLSILADKEDTVISNMPEITEVNLALAHSLSFEETDEGMTTGHLLRVDYSSSHPVKTGARAKGFLKKINCEPSATTLHEFLETPRMSTYLLAFAVGKFHKISGKTKNNIKVTTYAALNQPKSRLNFANDFAIKSLDFYDQLFDTKYPLPKLDQLALPDFESGAMENWGLVTYREQALLVDVNSAENQKLYVATVIAHELSHQWFGNLVTMQWWDDLWLNESFATLIETYAVDKIAPELAAWDDFYEGTVLSALRRDCLPGVQSVKCEVSCPADIASIFDGAIVYAKGARLLLMLMRQMGEQNFFKGLKSYFQKHAYKNTVSDDLWDSLGEYTDFDIKNFMSPWLTQAGYPVLDQQGKTQERFLLSSSVDPDFVYPVRALCDDLSGHYLINLNNVDFATALEDFSAKSKEQKLRLLIDRSLLAKTSRVDSTSLLPLIAKFDREEEYVIWSIIALLISDLKIFLKKNSNAEQDFKNFIKNLAIAQYQSLGIAIKTNENLNSTKLRPLILNLMAYSEDLEFTEQIQQRYANAQPADIDPSIRSSILTVVLRQASETQIDQIFKLYIKTDDPELKSDLMLALTNIKIEAQAQKFFTGIDKGEIRPQDRLYFFIRIARNQHLNNSAFTWFYQNWDKLHREEGDKTISDYPRLLAGTIKSEASAKKFKEFFIPKIKDPALTRELKVAFAEIDARLELIKADSPAVCAQLARLRNK